VGFRVRDKIFILVEAQTTWTMNILVRMFMYLAETYNNYFMETHQSLYNTKKVTFPKPELYVIYTGDRGDRKDVITLSEEFLGGEKCSLEVSAKVLFYSEHEDIISQYIKFTRIYNEQVAIYGRKRRAVIETIRICKNENVLKEYLGKRETEVVTIMMSLFDMEYIFNSYVDSRECQAEARGEEKGEARGIAKGKIETTIRMCKEFGVSLIDTVKRVIRDFDLSEDEAESRVREYWN
jgi:hypothetical protein